MNSPAPIDPNQPVLPAQAWYTSPLQLRLVAAGVSQAISMLLRTINLLGFEIHIAAVDHVDELAANLTQGVALGFVAWAWWKRQRSQIAPLTMTAKGAEDLTRINPPVLDADPTKVKK